MDKTIYTNWREVFELGAGGEVGTQLRLFCRAETRGEAARDAVKLLTEAISSELGGILPNKPDIVLPILRAGLPMMIPILRWARNSRCEFAVARRTSRGVSVRLGFETKEVEGKRVLLLDTIGATGATVATVAQHLRHASSVSGVLCYSSFQAIDQIERCGLVQSLVIGCTADRVDSEGYLHPITNGDAGDKLFGYRSQST